MIGWLLLHTRDTRLSLSDIEVDADFRETTVGVETAELPDPRTDL